MSLFRNVAHLYHPIVEEIDTGIMALEALVFEMDRRIALGESECQYLPFIVCIIDEFDDTISYVDKKDFNRFVNALNSLILRGRKAKVIMILASHDPTLKNTKVKVNTPWVMENRRAWEATLAILHHAFAGFMDRPVINITEMQIEEWRTKFRNEQSTKAVTVNKYITMLKAVFNWAVRRKKIDANPITQLEKLREDDSNVKIRYLSPEERERLFSALDAREERIRAGRNNHNEWLDARDKEKLPNLKSVTFVDNLKPMIIVSLNTGIRRGSLFGLLWSDINFDEGTLTIRPATEKNSKLIHIPMNSTLTKTLRAWEEQTSGEGLVFPSPKTGAVMNNCKSAWNKILHDSNIRNFRWHDMRHDFASQLVMNGVDLNTVRELLGHTDMKMTLRYAHLAPQVKRAAVELLTKEENVKI